MTQKPKNSSIIEDDEDEFEIVTEDDDDVGDELSTESPEIVDDLYSLKSPEKEKEEEEVEVVDKKEKDEGGQDERKEFGKRAEKRIKALLSKTKELEAKLAEREAEMANARKEQLNSKRSQMEAQYNQIATREKELEALDKSVLEAYKAARENNDYDAEIAAQEARQQIIGEKQAIANAKRQIEAARQKPEWGMTPQEPQYRQQVQIPDEQYQANRQPAREPDARAIQWWNANPWFNQDMPKTTRAAQIHRDLLDEGINPDIDTDEYYEELDARLQAEFPEIRKGNQQKRKASPVSGGGRANPSGSSKGKIKITQSMIDYCNRMGLDVKKYAKEVQKLRDQGKDI